MKVAHVEPGKAEASALSPLLRIKPAAQATAGVLRNHATIAREAFGQAPLRTPEILLKVIEARLHHDLGAVDFLLYDLINRPRATWRDYLREHPHNDRMLRILHPFDIEFVVRDKLLAAERFVERGVPIVPVLAVVGRREPCAGHFPRLVTAEAIGHALRDWPNELFVKPVSGSFGENAMALTRDGDRWLTGSERLSEPELARRLLALGGPTGALVQRRYRNDPRMAGISCGIGLCATRVITALTVDGPEIVAVIHKLLRRNAIADNFAGGMTGNFVCGVDLPSGRLGVAYGRQGGNRLLLTQYAEHPSTGARIAGFQLPQWDAARQVALDAARAFPELPLLGHDIAITGEGPLVLETNTHWRISLPQLAAGGMRPVLRRLLPRLAASPERRDAALRAIA